MGCSLSADAATSWIYSKGNAERFWPKVTHPLLILASQTKHSMANYDRMVRDSAMVTMESPSTGNQHRSFEWYYRWLPMTSPSPKMGVPNAPLAICRISNGHISMGSELRWCCPSVCQSPTSMLASNSAEGVAVSHDAIISCQGRGLSSRPFGVIHFLIVESRNNVSMQLSK